MTVRRQIRHRIVGYDPVSERLEFSFELPNKAMPFLSKFIRFEEDDPDGYDAYRVDYSIVSDIAGMLHLTNRPPPRLEYFLEPSGVRLT